MRPPALVAAWVLLAAPLAFANPQEPPQPTQLERRAALEPFQRPRRLGFAAAVGSTPPGAKRARGFGQQGQEGAQVVKRQSVDRAREGESPFTPLVVAPLPPARRWQRRAWARLPRQSPSSRPRQRLARARLQGPVLTHSRSSRRHRPRRACGCPPRRRDLVPQRDRVAQLVLYLVQGRLDLVPHPLLDHRGLDQHRITGQRVELVERQLAVGHLVVPLDRRRGFVGRAEHRVRDLLGHCGAHLDVRGIVVRAGD